jgi:hypothetical protein
MTEMERQPDEPAAAPTPTAGARLVRTVMIVVMLIALAVGLFALARLDLGDESRATTSPRFTLDLQAQVQIPPDRIAYRQQSQFSTTLQVPRALAVSSDGTILVAGDRAIVRLSAQGQVLGTIPLEQAPTCLAVGGAGAGAPEQIYVGCGRHVSVFSAEGEPVSQWPDLAPSAVLTAIAVGPQRVFVADAGQRVVHVLDAEGRTVGRIGAADPARHASEFIVPSPYFDLAIGPGELLWVVNPGLRRVESYTDGGELQSMWGESGSGLAEFFGCCNPAHLALLPDGRFVTSETGIPRIKVYSEAGEFEHVVAGPRELGVSSSALVDARGDRAERVFDVAVAPDGSVCVLDTGERAVRVFVLGQPEVTP